MRPGFGRQHRIYTWWGSLQLPKADDLHFKTLQISTDNFRIQYSNMAFPENYTRIPAHEESIQQARSVKKSHGLTWNEFFEKAAEALED